VPGAEGVVVPGTQEGEVVDVFLCRLTVGDADVLLCRCTCLYGSVVDVGERPRRVVDALRLTGSQPIDSAEVLVKSPAMSFQDASLMLLLPASRPKGLAPWLMSSASAEKSITLLEPGSTRANASRAAKRALRNCPRSLSMMLCASLATKECRNWISVCKSGALKTGSWSREASCQY